MRTLSKPTLKALLVFSLALALLVPGYYGNTWRAAGKKWFVDWQKFHENLVVARLVQSRQAGIFSYGALLGFGDLTTWEYNASVIDHEYELFANGGEFKAYWPYQSVPGLQAIPFSLLDTQAGLAPATTLKVFRLGEALLTAIVLGGFLLWILAEFGLVAALVTLAFLAASEWLTLFGANFYWNLWAFYLPLVALAFYLRRFAVTGQPRPRDIFWILAVTLLLKGLVNGFEFVSAALILPFAPLVYQALQARWPWKVFLSRFAAAALGALTGTLAALAILATQIASVLGGWPAALAFIAHTLGKRSFGNPALYSPSEAESLRANLFSILWTYLNGRALNLNGPLGLNLPGLEISYLQLLLSFALVSLVFLLRDRFWGGFPNRQVALALLAATWFSLLAPLSWFVLFKAHSYIHTQINFILWQMPFTLFGFAFCGLVLGSFFQTKK